MDPTSAFATVWLTSLLSVFACGVLAIEEGAGPDGDHPLRWYLTLWLLPLLAGGVAALTAARMG